MEMYAATRDSIKERLSHLKQRLVAPITLLMDLWEDKLANCKYFGT